MAKKLKPREAVVRMAPYSPPTSGRAGKVRLDFNENTIGCSPRVVQYLAEKLSQDQLSVYPEYEATRAALEDYFRVPQSQFLITNGTDEAIQVLVNTFVGEGGEALILTPSYAMYRFYAELAGAKIRQVPYRRPDLSFPLEELLNAINPATKAILLSNPNNPTGTAFGLSETVRILAAAPNAAVLVDEAYFEFYGVTALGLLDEYPNLLVSRTFSKAFGMAAMRVGCLFSQAANVEFLRKAQSPYSVNMPAAIAVRVAVEDREYVDDFVKEALKAREIIAAGLSARKIPYWPSRGNFVLFDAGGRAKTVCAGLRALGVLVRDRGHDILGSVRVTAGTEAQAKQFLAGLDEVWR